MARPRNQAATVILKLAITRQSAEYLADLTATGFFGTHPTVTAVRLIDRGIEDALKNGTIQRRRPKRQK